MTPEKPKPHRANGEAPKMNKRAGRSDRFRKADFRLSRKPLLARASSRYQELASAYKGPYIGWWRCLSW
jgi:hypothetical protein